MKRIIKSLLLMLLVLLPIKVFAIEKPALSSLVLEGGEEPYSFDLASSNTTFTHTISGNIEKATIVATPVNESYTVSGDGEIALQEGLNRIIVTITDPSDNSTMTYRIALTYNKTDASKDAVDPVENDTTGQDAKSADEETTGEKNPKTGSFANYIVISLIVLIPLIILISRKKIYKL